MYQNQHFFHIPVMGTGHSIDSPARVAHLGINSVVSIVDDLLCEKIRKYYSEHFNLPFKGIPRTAEDGRARRITAFLDTMQSVVNKKFEELKSQPLFSDSLKDRYFNLLPDTNPLKVMYNEIRSLSDASAHESLIEKLTSKMTPGSIDVNIMTKVDALSKGKDGNPQSAEYSDASAALRGYANSSVSSSLILSAGFNPRLYGYLSEFRDFYRDVNGRIKKSLILKVSDFRSALIQGKFLAKKGLEIAEFRIESGLNCGGHAFASDGQLMPVLLREFREKKAQLAETFQPLIKSYYEQMGWEYKAETDQTPKITVQGGIGTSGEMERLLNDFEMDGTGWGSPFLLVPEATCVDSETMTLLAESAEKDLYLSNVSPLGVPFNNIHNSGSDRHTKALIEKGKPGSKCPKGYLVTNTEFTEDPLCTASAEYQLLKINHIKSTVEDSGIQQNEIDKVLDKTCLCTNLGTGSLIRLGILKPEYGRQEVCPGPNIAWFNREYTLQEMVEHIYGKIESLVDENRPHMFAKELTMYVDYINERMVLAWGDAKQIRQLEKMRKNVDSGIDYCLEIANSKPYKDENLTSLKVTALKQRERLNRIFEETLEVT